MLVWVVFGVFPKVSVFIHLHIQRNFTFLVSCREVYQMQVAKMSYGNGMLSLVGENGRVGKVLFDTGSSYTYFPNKAYSQLVTSVSNHILKLNSLFLRCKSSSGQWLFSDLCLSKASRSFWFRVNTRWNRQNTAFLLASKVLDQVRMIRIFRETVWYQRSNVQ